MLKKHSAIYLNDLFRGFQAESRIHTEVHTSAKFRGWHDAGKSKQSAAAAVKADF